MLLGCWRFRWQAVATAWAVGVLGWALVFTLPDVYTASARVYVDTQSSLRPLLQGLAVDSDVMVRVNLMTRALLSQPSLEQLAREADLDLQVKDKAQMEALVQRLQAGIKITREGNDIVAIAFDHNDRQKALKVVTTLVNRFIEGSLGEARSDSTVAQQFLLDKLKEYEAKLNESENRLADFKRRNVGLMPGDDQDYYGRLQQEIGKLEALNASINVARNRRDELQRQIEGEEPVFGLIAPENQAGSPVSSLDGQIAEFEKQIAELRLKYTDSHPDIVQLKNLIAELQAKKAAQEAERPASARVYSPLDLNPVYQQMKLQLSQAQLELAQLETQRADQARVVADLRRKVDTTPAVEAELKRLTRDYDTTRAQYTDLLKRVEQSRITQDAEQSKDEVTFRIIDPPTVPLIPSGPNRPLLFTAVLVLAVVAAIAVAVGLNLAKPVFYTSRDLQARFGIPVLGAIRLARSPREVAAGRRRAVVFAMSLAGLLLSYGTLMALGMTLLRSSGEAGGAGG